MDPTKLDLSELPAFYRNLFKVWSFFHVQKTENSHSLHWLLQEPLILGARLDIDTHCYLPGFSTILLKSKVFTLGHLLTLTGPQFENVDVVSKHLGIRSVRLLTRFFVKLKSYFTVEEEHLLRDFFTGVCTPDVEDPFPCLIIQPNLEEGIGFLLKSGESLILDFLSSEGKKLYRACVLVFNKKMLEKRTDTPWRSVFKLRNDVKPEWRSLYKPPLSKRFGDIQWRILHGAIAVNSFISVLNPEVNSACPFCLQRETVFHAFMHCFRLEPLFMRLKELFCRFDETFCIETFILGFKYFQKKRFICQLLNFILGQAKMAIYISRKNRVEQKCSDDVNVCFLSLIKSRVFIDFRYYKTMRDLSTFELIWCGHGALCTVCEGDLFFSL
jgi:hypothetical protein